MLISGLHVPVKTHRLDVNVDIIREHHLLNIRRVGVNVARHGEGEGHHQGQKFLGERPK